MLTDVGNKSYNPLCLLPENNRTAKPLKNPALRLRALHETKNFHRTNY
jgi:hypothetical protein